MYLVIISQKITSLYITFVTYNTVTVDLAGVEPASENLSIVLLQA